MTTSDSVTTSQMQAELAIVFPALTTRPLAEFSTAYIDEPGLWTGAASRHQMPDGEPIFDTLDTGEGPFSDGPVHGAFVAWLAARGWTWERWDGDTFWLLPREAL